MKIYRIVSREGVELSTVRATCLVEALAMTEASCAPIGARIVSESSRVLARRELWIGESPGWSLVKAST
jgi:hypothetical protein